MRNIDADYYGYMDDDDGLLVPAEEKCEKEAIKKKIEQWKNSETNDVDVDEAFVLPEMNVSHTKNLLLCSFVIKFSFQSDDEDYVAGRSSGTNVDVTSKDHVFIAHVPVPSQKDVRFSNQVYLYQIIVCYFQIERALLERKKQELLAKYVSDDLLKEEQESKDLLGK